METDDVPDEDDQHNTPETQKTSRAIYKDWSTRRIVLYFIIATGAILAAGFVLARTSDALSIQTGLGASFVGATLLATSTSLPELSTTISATRLGNYSMAVSNIFGSNALMIVLIFVSDVFYREGLILNNVGKTATFSLSLGAIVTAIYLAGLVERKDKTFLRMGIDSIAVLICYLGGLVILYTLR